jgi:hypothetical protein
MQEKLEERERQNVRQFRNSDKQNELRRHAKRERRPTERKGKDREKKMGT